MGERSGIRIHAVAPRISWLLFKGFWWRMKEKYVIRDFHPLVFFYVLGALMTTARPRPRGGGRRRRASAGATRSRRPTVVLVALLLIAGFQFSLFGMWLDREENDHLG